MKTIATTFLIVLLAFCFVSSTSVAVTMDSVKVAALPPGNLNNFINADTTASGFAKPNRVYVLQQDAGLDTVYYMTAPITVKGSVYIVGKINPVTGHPPVVAPSIAGDNSSIGYFFGPQGDDTLSLKGIYFLGTRTDDISFTGRFVSPAGDNNVFYFDHCILENISGEGTPNLFDTWENDHNSFYITNCLFRNNQDDNPQNPGFAWIDPGEYPCDTAIFRNNTFFLTGGYVLGSAGYGCTYLKFDHNTIFFSGQGGAFDIYQMHNAVITNNIFFSVSSAAYPESWYADAPGTWGSAIIPLDSLRSLAAEPYNMKEADRYLTITNNAYFWPQIITDKWTELNTNGITDVTPLRAPDFINAQPGMLTDKVSWPNITVENNVNEDPAFNATLVSTAGANMANFVDVVWHNNGAALGVRPYVNPLPNPPSLTSDWPNVASNWAETQGYPVPENLAYTNSSMMNGGTDGKALGDLNWFPDQINDVTRDPNYLPENYSLSQNYPNPFNPSTEIKYSIPSSGFVTLKVFNLLGQEIATLVNQEQTSGSYRVNFDASNLATGVYIYSIKAGNFTLSKKMVMIK